MAVALRDVNKQYPGMDRPALHGVTLSVDVGESLGLLGPNGAGKTTLVKLLCGATPITAGCVEVFGVDLSGHKVQFKGRIGVVHQSPAFEMMLSVADNLRIAASLKQVKRATAQTQIAQLLSEFGLEDRKKQLVFTLSGGEQKRLALIRALLGQPELLILDEPSAGLDVEGKRRLWHQVQDARYTRGIALLWTSHDMSEIERNCDRVAVLHRGELVAMSTPHDLAQRGGTDIAVIEVRQSQDFVRLEALLASTGLSGQRVGTNFEVRGPNVRAQLLGLLQAMQDLGCDVDALKFRSPTLEDAFVELTRD